MPIHQIDTEVRIITDFFLRTSIGDTAAYSEISKLLGRDVRHRERHKLYQAQKLAREEGGAIFESIYKVGYRRLPGDEGVKIGHTWLSRMRRGGKNVNKTIAIALTANDIPSSVHRKMLSQQSTIGLIVELSRDKNLPTIEEGATAPIPYAIAARMFLDAMNR